MKCRVTALLAVVLAVSIGTTAWANDELIAKQTIERLQQQKQQSQLEEFNIGIQVDQGTVTVMGTVQEPAHAILALEVVRRVPGVKLVVNDLFIQTASQTGDGADQAPRTKSLIVSAPNALIPADSTPSVQPAGLVPNAPASAPQETTTGPKTTAEKTPALETPALETAALETAALETAALETAATATQTSETPTAKTPEIPATSGTPTAPLTTPEPPLAQPTPPQPEQALALRAPATPETTAKAAPIAEPQQLQQVTTPQSLNAKATPRGQMPLAFARAGAQPVNYHGNAGYTVPRGGETYYAARSHANNGQTRYTGVSYSGQPVPMNATSTVGYGHGSYDNPQMPGYAWPSYASYPNYAAVTYPHQYSPTAWPYIGPFYPYPQVPLGWRKVTLEWDDGWWFLDFKSK